MKDLIRRGTAGMPDRGDITAGSEDGGFGSDPARMKQSAEHASAFLRALSHEGRLMILCHLVRGEKSVSELETLMDMRQAAVSQQLSRLRLEGLVVARRDGKAIFYTIKDPKVLHMITVLHAMFCPQD